MLAGRSSSRSAPTSRIARRAAHGQRQQRRTRARAVGALAIVRMYVCLQVRRQATPGLQTRTLTSFQDQFHGSIQISTARPNTGRLSRTGPPRPRRCCRLYTLRRPSRARSRCPCRRRPVVVGLDPNPLRLLSLTQVLIGVTRPDQQSNREMSTGWVLKVSFYRQVSGSIHPGALR
jgi:hypothetical protein